MSALGGNTLASLAAGPGEGDGVPQTLPAALGLFFRHPSTVLAMAVISSLAILRSTCGPVDATDALVAVISAMVWIVQEWAIHRYLLHSSFAWLGKSIHEAHHAQPYHHVSIDSPQIVAAFMTVSGGLAWLLLHGNTALVCTACISYFTTGLFSYQLVHYLVHTRWVPQGSYMRAVRQHHMRHHLRNHDHWFAFSVPQIDGLFGTLPSHPSKVPLKVVPRPHEAGSTTGSMAGSPRQPAVEVSSPAAAGAAAVQWHHTACDDAADTRHSIGHAADTSDQQPARTQRVPEMAAVSSR